MIETDPINPGQPGSRSVKGRHAVGRLAIDQGSPETRYAGLARANEGNAETFSGMFWAQAVESDDRASGSINSGRGATSQISTTPLPKGLAATLLGLP